MRIDPARNVEIELEDLQKQLNELRQQCRSYFRMVEEIRSRRDGWKQNRSMNQYGTRF
jgi:hypothetical protein